jgi:hypothetical protein
MSPGFDSHSNQAMAEDRTTVSGPVRASGRAPKPRRRARLVCRRCHEKKVSKHSLAVSLTVSIHFAIPPLTRANPLQMHMPCALINCGQIKCDLDSRPSGLHNQPCMNCANSHSDCQYALPCRFPFHPVTTLPRAHPESTTETTSLP